MSGNKNHDGIAITVSKKKLARGLYQALDLETKESLKRYLTSVEVEALNKETTNLNISEINKINKEININRDENHFRFIWYFLIHLGLSVYCLFADKLNEALYFFAYSTLGFVFLRMRSTNHWRLLTIKAPFIYTFPLMAGLLVVVNILMANLEAGGSFGMQLGYVAMIMKLISGPIFEEIFFRELFYQALLPNRGRPKEVSVLLAIVIPAILFTAMHFHTSIELETYGYMLVAGINFGILRWYTQGLVYPIICHCLTNAAVIWL